MIQAERKSEILSQHRRHESDSGSAEVQVAFLTERVTQLTEHLKTHKKDHAARRGLLKMVGKRSALLRYLSEHTREKYLQTIQKLGLRR